MTTTYKYNSRIITILSFIVMLTAAITPEAWQTLIPNEYWVFIPTMMAVLSYLATQLSEEHRVEVAEQMVIEKQSELINQQETNTEYTDEC